MIDAARPIGTRFEMLVPARLGSTDPQANDDRIFTYEVVAHEAVYLNGFLISPTEVVKCVKIRPATDEERKDHERKK